MDGTGEETNSVSLVWEGAAADEAVIIVEEVSASEAVVTAAGDEVVIIGEEVSASEAVDATTSGELINTVEEANSSSVTCGDDENCIEEDRIGEDDGISFNVAKEEVLVSSSVNIGSMLSVAFATSVAFAISVAFMASVPFTWSSAVAVLENIPVNAVSVDVGARSIGVLVDIETIVVSLLSDNDMEPSSISSVDEA